MYTHKYIYELFVLSRFQITYSCVFDTLHEISQCMLTNCCFRYYKWR